MNKIRFTINYEVKQKNKIERFVNRFESSVNYQLNEITIERYRKINTQFQAKFYIESHNNSVEKTIYEVLILANNLWPSGYFNWTFNGPYETNGLIFECILNNENDDQPLKWAHIELGD